MGNIFNSSVTVTWCIGVPQNTMSAVISPMAKMCLQNWRSWLLNRLIKLKMIHLTRSVKQSQMACWKLSDSFNTRIPSWSLSSIKRSMTHNHKKNLTQIWLVHQAGISNGHSTMIATSLSRVLTRWRRSYRRKLLRSRQIFQIKASALASVRNHILCRILRSDWVSK